MIRTLLKPAGAQAIALDGLPAPAQDADVLWLEVFAPTRDEAQQLGQRFGIDVAPPPANVVEDEHYLYLRSRLVMLGLNGEPQFANVTFALGERLVATITENADFRPFRAIVQRCNRRPSNAQSPKALLRLLLHSANDSAAAVIDHVAQALDAITEEITQVLDGYNAKGQELGVSDLTLTMGRLTEMEEVILRCVEAALSLARTVRYLGVEVDDRTEPDLQALVSELAGDVAGSKEHAAFEHEKVRYLQSALNNVLNLKQNQIVKVFTVVATVFLPPTLVGTFYGMNFAVMPELAWEHGFLYSMLLTLAAALLPLYYVKRRGWLR